MRLYRNVTKSLLSIKTPRRMYIEPGMVIDVDTLGDFSRSDIAMFIDRQVLVPIETAKKAEKKTAQAPKPVKPVGKGEATTEVSAIENKTVVVKSTVPEENDKLPVTELGRISKSGSAAAVISAPPDTAATMNPSQAPPTKGAAYDALPQDVKDKIAAVEKMTSGNPAAAKPKKAKKAKATK